MKTFLISIVFMLIINNIIAQNQFVGTVEYSINYINKPENNRNIQYPQKLTIKLIGDKIRFDLATSTSRTATLLDNKSDDYYILLNIMGYNYALKKNKVIINTNNTSIEYTNETKRIAQFDCKKAIITTINYRGQAQISNVYYSSSINNGWVNDNTLFHGLKGMPMSYQTYNEDGLVMEYVATKVILKNVNSKDFKIPKEYQIISSSKFNEMFGVGEIKEDVLGFFGTMTEFGINYTSEMYCNKSDNNTSASSSSKSEVSNNSIYGTFNGALNGITNKNEKYTIHHKEYKIEHSIINNRLQIKLIGAYATVEGNKFSWPLDWYQFVEYKIGNKNYTESYIGVSGHPNEIYLDINSSTADILTIEKIVVDEQIKPFAWDNRNRRTFQLQYTIDLSQIKKEIYYNKTKNGSIDDCISYLKTNPPQEYKISIENELLKKSKTINDVIIIIQSIPELRLKFEDKLYDMVIISTDVVDCDKYLTNYTDGKYLSNIKKYKQELQAYNSFKTGGITECINYINEYPDGRFVFEAKSKKNDLVKEQERNRKIQANSNKSLWYLGDKVCYIDFNGIIAVSIDQWNENKSRFKGIVVASPGGLYEGEVLQKGNSLWIDPNGWHKCLDDELEYALRNDKSLEAEQLLKNKNKKFDTGTKVCFTGTQSAILFSYSVTIKGMVEEWNSDFTKMKVKITYDAGGTYYNGQNVYNGATIWVSPIGWKNCN